MDLLVPKGDLGFGDRSRRYSMLVRDGVIQKLFIEPDEPGDPFENPPWFSPSGPACSHFDSLPANRSILSLGTNQFNEIKAFCF